MDADDDNEYMNAAAAHAAFVMIVSAARMYWLLRSAGSRRCCDLQRLTPVWSISRFTETSLGPSPPQETFPQSWWP